MEMPAVDDEERILVGSIVITYYLNQTGDPKVEVDRPDFDRIPALVQLGMVSFAEYDVMHGSGDKEID